MAKHKGHYQFGGRLYQQYLRLQNRWRFFVKPDLKKGVANVLGRIGKTK
jgi:hypothetical protein